MKYLADGRTLYTCSSHPTRVARSLYDERCVFSIDTMDAVQAVTLSGGSPMVKALVFIAHPR